MCVRVHVCTQHLQQKQSLIPLYVHMAILKKNILDAWNNAFCTLSSQQLLLTLAVLVQSSNIENSVYAAELVLIFTKIGIGYL